MTESSTGVTSSSKNSQSVVVTTTNGTNDHPKSGGGRGGRGGRGRGGRGRGGRGSGRGNKHHKQHKDHDSHKHRDEHKSHANGGHAEPTNATVPANDSVAKDDDDKNNNHNNKKKTTKKNQHNKGRGGGRGGRQGRGGGRGGRGGGKHHSKDPDQHKEDEAVATHGEHGDTPPVETTTTTTTPTKKVLALPPLPPPSTSGRADGGPIVLSRHSHPPVTNEGSTEQQSQSLSTSDENKEETNGTKQTPKKDKKKKKPKKKKAKKSKDEDDDDHEGDEEEPTEAVVEPTATEALEKLAPQQVSITASTQVKILRHGGSSSNSLSKQDGTSPNASMSGGAGKSGKKKKKQKSGEVSQTKAARRFNNEVRSCVERSEPDALRELLHDKRNHKYALDGVVLETTLKAYVMAAFFEDALYCLRNCTLPGTLSIGQTERILTCIPQNLRNSSAYTAADMINALCIATEFDQPTSRTYFLRIVRGIALEFLEEATSARDRICSSPCERLIRAGLCVVDARLRRGKKPTELVVVPGDQLGCFVPDTMEQRGIAAGDAVSILPYAGPYPMSAESLDRNMIEATVVNTNPTVLRLQDKMNVNLHAMLTDTAEGNVYRIDKLANRMGFNRQLAAAVSIAGPLGDPKTRDFRRPCPELIKAITAMDENIDRVFLRHEQSSNRRGGLTSTAALCAEAIPWNVEDEKEDFDQDSTRQAARLALEKYGAFEGLNASQRLAVEGATTHRLTLVQGPPGTGKTAVAIRILQHWARVAAASCSNGEKPKPILATSDSNIAVDNLVEGCANVGLRVVRLGRPEAIRPELLRYCVDRGAQSSNNSTGNDRTGGLNSPNNYSGGTTFQQIKERMKQLKNAQIICCTCIGSGGDILDSLGPLERILVDEATQATEAAVLVPLMRGCRQLVLVGDHCQLPPTVLSTRAEEEGHGVPLFSRMVACGVPPFMLDTQYRMHPCIAMFPSDLFYGGLLKNGVSAPERRPLAGFPWPREEFPVAFVPVKGDELDDGVSKYNEAEAAAACDAVAALLQGGQCAISDIAVVTPYAAQARLIRRLVRRLTPDSGPPYIEVSSVDGFQGREKEAVVFSAVRSNDYGAIGFTSDWRRVNVSFTRARRALIVIGNDQTLRRGDPDTWMPWLAWADAHGLNMDKPGVPRGRYEPEQLRRVRGGTTAAEMLKDVLERQQAQLKTAEQQQERAEQNTRNHIMGGSGDDAEDGNDGENGRGGGGLTLEEDLAKMENIDGNWDDSDDDDGDVGNLRHSVSKTTLTSASSSNDMQSGDDSSDAVDIWDL